MQAVLISGSLRSQLPICIGIGDTETLMNVGVSTMNVWVQIPTLSTATAIAATFLYVLWQFRHHELHRAFDRDVGRQFLRCLAFAEWDYSCPQRFDFQWGQRDD